MSADVRPIEKGDRFEDKDYRMEGRTVKVVGLFDRGTVKMAQIEVETHPTIPSAVGRVTSIKTARLRTHYTRLSH